MSAPDFEWVTYDVSTVNSAAAVAPVTIQQVTIPNLNEWPRARDKVRILLETAGEVEHALLVQYLYAANSLIAPAQVADPAQKAALKVWNRTLVDTARDEMGHLMTVQNLLLAVGLPPNLEREDYPPRKALYPFTLHLEPLTECSLAKYVAAEAPRDTTDVADIIAIATEAAGSMVNRVGGIYGLLGVVFSTAQQVIDGGSGNGSWDDELRRYAAAAYEQNGDRAAWHLDGPAIDPQTLILQGHKDDWGRVPIHRIGDRAAARAAIFDVAAQGEGPSAGDRESHFDRYRHMFRGENGIPKFPPGGDFAPTLPVPTDPKAAALTDPRTRRWAQLADMRYGLMLGFIEHYLRTPDTGDRALISGWARDEMASLKLLSRQLVTLPSSSGVAAVPFGLPAVLHLPATAAERWQLHRARTEAVLAHVIRMRQDPADANHADLNQLVENDTARLAQMPSGPPVV